MTDKEFKPTYRDVEDKEEKLSNLEILKGAACVAIILLTAVVLWSGWNVLKVMAKLAAS